MLQRTCPRVIGSGEGRSLVLSLESAWGPQSSLAAPSTSEAVLGGQTGFRAVWVELLTACACL